MFNFDVKRWFRREQAAADGGGKLEAFTFGDPLPVLDGRDILDYAESWWNGDWYEPPVSFSGLAKSYRVGAHHGSALQLKRNMLVKGFVPHPWLSKQDFSKWALDYLIFGNGYLEEIQNVRGRTMRLKPSPAKYTRRGKADAYFFSPSYFERHEFRPESIFHLLEPDPNQEFYGVPEYLGGLNSAWLNEDATLFRRKYYINGSHAGFVMYISDPAHEQKDIDAIRTSLKESKGVGNFKNLFLYSPNGKKDGIQIIPIAEVQAKDEFFNIKNVTRDDIIAAHRVFPILIGVVPVNAAGLGDAIKSAEVFHANEIEPLQERMRELNDWAGEEVVRFKPYQVSS